jgi:cysteine desulfurase/selenocysteine lyase
VNAATNGATNAAVGAGAAAGAAEGAAAGAAAKATPGYDVARVRRDFPILATTVHGKPLVYLDSAATSQKPTPVLEAERAYYEEANANVHRGVHALSERATALYEGARGTLARFVNAARAEEIVFTRGTTEAVNLVAWSFVRPRLGPGDSVLVTELEHHSNIVPWQLLCEERGARLLVCPIDDRGEVLEDAFATLLATPGLRFAAFAHVSNALGTVLPVARLVERAHAKGVPVLVDGAQAVPHLPVDVRALDADFYAFSAHKMFGPTGIGALYGRFELLDAMRPWQGGGDMIASVSFDGTTYNRVPYRFEAGTPHIAGAIGFAAAAKYMESIGREAIAAHEHALLEYATAALARVPGLTLVGTAREKASVLSFTMTGIHPHDVGTILDQEGVAVRTGHHCAEPVMRRFGIPATARASLALYNTAEDVDALVRGLGRVREVFGS